MHHLSKRMMHTRGGRTHLVVVSLVRAVEGLDFEIGMLPGSIVDEEEVVNRQSAESVSVIRFNAVQR